MSSFGEVNSPLQNKTDPPPPIAANNDMVPKGKFPCGSPAGICDCAPRPHGKSGRYLTATRFVLTITYREWEEPAQGRKGRL
jgi:hypothetical protein